MRAERVACLINGHRSYPPTATVSTPYQYRSATVVRGMTGVPFSRNSEFGRDWGLFAFEERAGLKSDDYYSWLMTIKNH